MEKRYIVVQAPGYFGWNKAMVISAHKKLVNAQRAARRHGRGVAIALGYERKGDIVYGDMLESGAYERFPIK